MKKGWVSSTHQKHAVNSVVTIEVTSIPGDPDPVANALTVSSGTKVYCTLTENVYGEVTAAAIESGSSWLDSDAPEYIGGDDQTGTAGTRYIRLCEIVTVDGSVKVKVIHTGNIEHTAPPLVENTVTSVSSDEARVYKGFNSAQGRHDLRYLEGGTGINMTEGTDKITVAVDTSSNPYSHPWKVTPNGDDTVDVAAGCVMSWEESSLTLKNFKKYDGTQTITVTGTGYIYGYIDASLALTPDINAGGTDTGGDDYEVSINRVFPDNADTIAIAYATAIPTGSSIFYFEIAEVTVAAGVASVTYQTLTHNPTLASWIEPP
jgi:hypothetical protein